MSDSRLPADLPSVTMTVSFRFYEELNDFIVAERRYRSFELACPAAASVKHVIETVGVPHTEVELILVNGVSVDFAARLRDGDRVAVYPKFESLDIGPLLRLRARPLRVTRFVADAHLGGLPACCAWPASTRSTTTASPMPRSPAWPRATAASC